MSWLTEANRFLRRLQFSETNLLILLSVFVGLATAFGAIGFVKLIEYFYELFFGLTDQILTTAVGFANWGGYKWWFPVIPTLGGLLVGPVVYKYASEARGHGVPEVMNSVARMILASSATAPPPPSSRWWCRRRAP